MKKNVVRIVAALLVAMLALTLIPVGAFAYTVNVESEAYSEHPTYNEWLNSEGVEWPWSEGTEVGSGSITIKTSDYRPYVVAPDGKDYDLQGIVDWSKVEDPDADAPVSSSVTYKAEDFNSDGFAWAWLLYTPHQHSLTCWISDGTTHWKNCTVCRDKFVGQNWCQDGDEDGICNICGGDVPYHDIKVIDVEGAKITLNRDNASHRTKITADVEAEDGYKVGKLHFVKVRDDGTKQEITRYKKNGQFWTYMPTYEMEVSVDVTKTK